MCIRDSPKTLKTPVIFFFIAAAIYCVAAYGFGEFTRPMPYTQALRTIR